MHKRIEISEAINIGYEFLHLKKKKKEKDAFVRFVKINHRIAYGIMFSMQMTNMQQHNRM